MNEAAFKECRNWFDRPCFAPPLRGKLSHIPRAALYHADNHKPAIHWVSCRAGDEADFTPGGIVQGGATGEF
jgi:hypothetical protein